jgi:hypothetical protein
MSLRTQSNGYQKPWTHDELRDGMEEFYKEHGRYPTGPEVDKYSYLPSARSIERSFGGLIALRDALKLTGQNDFRTGAYSAERAHTIGDRANKTEQIVYEFLTEKFGKELVHREYFFADDARTRADFFVYDASGNFCVDVFYPSNYRNLTGCLNSKLQKYTAERLGNYPVIFLQMNPDISQKEVDLLIQRKQNGLSKGSHLMGWEVFVEFCSGRKKRVLA